MKHVEAMRKNLTCEKWTQLKLMQIRSNTLFFYRQRFFSTQHQCCLAFSWIELQMLLRHCLMYMTTIIPRHVVYLVYLCPCLGLSLFMSYLSDLFFIFSLIYSLINYVTSLKQTHLFFGHSLEYTLLFFGW